MHRVAQAGRLRVDAGRAAQIIHAAGCGVTLTLIATPPERRDPAVSELTREAVLAAVTTGSGQRLGSESPATADHRPAAALKAGLARRSRAAHAPELALLVEWLDRITRAGS